MTLPLSSIFSSKTGLGMVMRVAMSQGYEVRNNVWKVLNKHELFVTSNVLTMSGDGLCSRLSLTGTKLRAKINKCDM